MDELKPFPFCGSTKVEQIGRYGEYFVVCLNCSGCGPSAWGEQEAIEA